MAELTTQDVLVLGGVSNMVRKLTHNNFTVFILFSVLAWAVASVPAIAQTGKDPGIDLCNDVLRQDLFNRVTSNSQASESEVHAYMDSLFTLNEKDAYQEYKKEYESSQKQHTTGIHKGSYYGFGAVNAFFDFVHDYDRLISEDDFKKAFNTAKSEYTKSSSSSGSKGSSLISTYQSSARDQGTVKAWERCMVEKNPVPGLFAYGFRDPGGNPYITVLWAPGTFAAANPTVNVRFVPTDADMTIEGVSGETVIATGSGAAFPIRFKDSRNSKAKADGFVVLVNGELKSGEKVVQSFRSEATVPRNLGPTPCDLMLRPNGRYEVSILTTDIMLRLKLPSLVLTIHSEEPTSEPGAANYGGTMRAHFSPHHGIPVSPENLVDTTWPVSLTLAGSNIAIVSNAKKEPGEAPTMSGPVSELLSGECTGQGARGTINMGARGEMQFEIRASR